MQWITTMPGMQHAGITTMINCMQLDHFPPERNVLRTEGAEAEWNGKDG